MSMHDLTDDDRARLEGDWQRVTLVRGAPGDAPVVLDPTIGAWEGDETETYVPKADHDRKLADAEFVRVEETHRLRRERDAETLPSEHEAECACGSSRPEMERAGGVYPCPDCQQSSGDQGLRDWLRSDEAIEAVASAPFDWEFVKEDEKQTLREDARMGLEALAVLLDTKGGTDEA